MVPDEKFNEKIAKKEDEMLSEKVTALSEAQKDEVYTQVWKHGMIYLLNV